MDRAMFDAVVVSTAGPEAAARTLGTLVEGVVEGVLRRVVLASAADDPALRKLADEAGCRLAVAAVPGELGRQLSEHLETPHVLVAAGGALLPPGWPDALARELQRRGAPDAQAGFAFRPSGIAARLRLQTALMGGRRVAVAHGALVPRGALAARDFDGRSVPTGRGWRMIPLTVELSP
jgi:hypothetical protein